MFHTCGNQRNLSLRLSEVLDDIGINEKIVLQTRRAHLLGETMYTINEKSISRTSFYKFGSQSEGTTTVGLDADADLLICLLNFNVIQDLEECKHGFVNLLMIQDQTTSPGYCLLQLIGTDKQLPVSDNSGKTVFVIDAKGRILLKNTILVNTTENRSQHGPACTTKGTPGLADLDTVLACPCYSWPCEARAWIDRKGIGRWPTTDMKRYALHNGCFLVPVGSKVGQYPEYEWRISFSKAERCLMFNLNITQIRCYVLMKMVIKSFLQHPGEGNITSYMCKTVLLHCIENTHSNAWQQENLYTCLSCCLHVLYNCLQKENCPHFIILRNNLMAGRFSTEVKTMLLERMDSIIKSDGRSLLEIQIDDIGQRLQIKLNMICQSERNFPYVSKNLFCYLRSANLILNTFSMIAKCHNITLSEQITKKSETPAQILRNELESYARYYRVGSKLEKKAISLLSPLLCSTLGTILASTNIQSKTTVSSEALDWLNVGLNSDITSGRLKLASVYYSQGSMTDTEKILRTSEEMCFRYEDIHSICGCYDFTYPTEILKKFSAAAYFKNEESLKNYCALCVKFTPYEIHCVPHELQYEMFRSRKEDLQYRDKQSDFWMDWAVVDSPAYLHFLQYKTYGHLKMLYEQQAALHFLHRVIGIQKNFGHKETALNLLGQCMEQENQPNKALHCYMGSLEVRERNNVAKVHICRLLAKLISAKTCKVEQEK